MQKTKILLIFSFVVIFILSSCNKSNDDNIWFIKSATYCAEAWEGESWVTLEFEENAKTWLEMKGVIVVEAEYLTDAFTPEACNACSCLSGGAYRIQANANFTTIMTEEGFEIE